MNSNRISEKLSILADAAKYDVSCASSGSDRKNSKPVFVRSGDRWDQVLEMAVRRRNSTVRRGGRG